MSGMSEGEDVEATGGVLWAGEVFGFEANVDACGEGGEGLKSGFLVKCAVRGSRWLFTRLGEQEFYMYMSISRMNMHIPPSISLTASIPLRPLSQPQTKLHITKMAGQEAMHRS